MMELEQIIKYLKRGSGIINFEDGINKLSDIIPIAQKEILAYNEYLAGSKCDERAIKGIKESMKFREEVIKETKTLIKRMEGDNNDSSKI